MVDAAAVMDDDNVGVATVVKRVGVDGIIIIIIRFVLDLIIYICGTRRGGEGGYTMKQIIKKGI